MTELDRYSENIFFDKTEATGYDKSERGLFTAKKGPEHAIRTLHSKYAPEKSKHNHGSVREGMNRGVVPMFVRKYFHVVIICVYLPGIMYSHRLLYLASFAAIAVFLLIEVCNRCNSLTVP